MFPPDGRPRTALPPARAGLGPRGAGRARARGGLRRPRERRGDGPGLDGAAAVRGGIGTAALAREPPRLPPLRPVDRPRRQRLSVLRPAPGSPERRVRWAVAALAALSAIAA